MDASTIQHMMSLHMLKDSMSHNIAKLRFPAAIALHYCIVATSQSLLNLSILEQTVLNSETVVSIIIIRK